MFTEMMMSAGGGTEATLSIDEYDLEANSSTQNVIEVECTKAIYLMGVKGFVNEAKNHFFGYLDESGVHNYGVYGTATYSNGKLTLSSVVSNVPMWLKLMYW